MPTETLHFENARLAQQLFNNEPRNLQALDDRTGRQSRRARKLDQAGRPGGRRGTGQGVVSCLERFAEKRRRRCGIGNLRTRWMSSRRKAWRRCGRCLPNGSITSPRKAPVVPKTVGQKKYVDAIRATRRDLRRSARRARARRIWRWRWRCWRCKEEKVSRIILTRPAVEAGEALGFLPGDLYEKITPYLRPLHDALHDMLPAEEIEKHMERGIIEIAPLAYMRGRTLNNAFIILDEAQNSTSRANVHVFDAAGHEFQGGDHRGRDAD